MLILFTRVVCLFVSSLQEISRKPTCFPGLNFDLKHGFIETLLFPFSMTPSELIYSKFEMTRDHVNKTSSRLRTRAIIGVLALIPCRSKRQRARLLLTDSWGTALLACGPECCSRCCRAAVLVHHDPSHLPREQMMLTLPSWPCPHRSAPAPLLTPHSAAGGVGLFWLPRCHCPPTLGGTCRGVPRHVLRPINIPCLTLNWERN